MCTQHYHHCRSCTKQFICEEEDWICPTMNYDVDANLCEGCKKELHDNYLAMEKQEREKVNNNE